MISLTPKTLEHYLADAHYRGQTEHSVVVNRDASDKITFVISPQVGGGYAHDFVVRGNALAPNLTSDSDVPQGVDIGGMAVATSSLASCASAPLDTPVHEATMLGHCAASLSDALYSLSGNGSRNAEVESALAGLVKRLCSRAIELLGPEQAAQG